MGPVTHVSGAAGGTSAFLQSDRHNFLGQRNFLCFGRNLCSTLNVAVNLRLHLDSNRRLSGYRATGWRLLEADRYDHRSWRLQVKYRERVFFHSPTLRMQISGLERGYFVWRAWKNICVSLGTLFFTLFVPLPVAKEILSSVLLCAQYFPVARSLKPSPISLLASEGLVILIGFFLVSVSLCTGKMIAILVVLAIIVALSFTDSSEPKFWRPHWSTRRRLTQSSQRSAETGIEGTVQHPCTPVLLSIFFLILL